MASLELHEGLRSHRKLFALARRLKQEDRDLVRAKLENLWLWALSNRPDGNLDELEPHELAAAANWKGDAKGFVSALVAERWLDANPLRIHDWQQYVGKKLRIRERDRLRKQAYRASVPRDVPRTVPRKVPEDVPRDKAVYKERAQPGARGKNQNPDLGIDRPPLLDRASLLRAREVATKLYREKWSEAMGMPAVVRGADAVETEKLLQTVGVENVCKAIPVYCDMRAGYWFEQGLPLRGLAQSWSEVAVALRKRPADAPPPPKPEPPRDDAPPMTEEPADARVWSEILRSLRGEVNSGTFETWFKPTSYLGTRVDGALVIAVPSALFRDWLSERYAATLEKFGRVVQYVVRAA